MLHKFDLLAVEFHTLAILVAVQAHGVGAGEIDVEDQGVAAGDGNADIAVIDGYTVAGEGGYVVAAGVVVTAGGILVPAKV